MVRLGALKVVRLRLVPLQQLLARTNKQRPPSGGSTTIIPLKDRVLSADLLLHGDPTEWLRRGISGSNNKSKALGGGSGGSLFLVPKRALRRVIAAELEAGRGQEASSGPTTLPLAVALPPHQQQQQQQQRDGKGNGNGNGAGGGGGGGGAAASALALLEESGEEYQITLPRLLAQAQAQAHKQHEQEGDGDAAAAALLAQTMWGLGVVERPLQQQQQQQQPGRYEQQSEMERQAFAAVREGDLATLRALLDDNPSLASRARHPEHGATLLHLAVARPPSLSGHEDSGSDEAAAEEEEEEDASLQVIDALLDAGADPDASAANGSTPLHWAAGNGHARAVRRLLQRGADAHAATYTWGRSVTGKASGQLPAHWGAESGCVSVLEVLASHAPLALVMPDERGRTPRALAEASGAVGAVLEGAEKEEFVVVEARVEAQAVRVLRERSGGGGGGDGVGAS